MSPIEPQNDLLQQLESLRPSSIKTTEAQSFT